MVFTKTAVTFLLTCLLSQAFADVSHPQPTTDEVSASRFAESIPGLWERTYDLDGQKAEWLLGTSILGNPDVNFTVAGIAEPTRRLPAKLGGLYLSRPVFDPSQLGLNGENGMLLEDTRRAAPVDTPVTSITWERFAFNGNSFGLNFRRLLVDSVELDIGLASHSDKGSKEFRYQDVTNQPYFSLGRDSASIPFTGRNVAMHSMHFKPAITWYLPKAEITGSLNYLTVNDDDVSNHAVILDSLDYTAREYQKPPFTAKTHSATFGIAGEWRPLNLVKLNASFYGGSHDFDYDSLPQFVESVADTVDEDGETVYDTTWTDSVKSFSYTTKNGNFGIALRTVPLNPSLNMDYEFLDADDHRYQDRELTYLQLEDTLGALRFRTQGGAQRNSGIDDSVEYKGALSAAGTLELPFHLQLVGMYRHDTRFPDVDELRYVNTGRVVYPNADLRAETRNSASGTLQWDAGGIFYGLGIRRESMDDMIKPKWVSGSSLDDVATAYKLENLGYSKSWNWDMTVGFGLGNWKFFLEREAVLDRDGYLMDVPRLMYKGSIYWHDRLVYNRLGVTVRADFQWFGNRYDCEINEDGDPELVELKHYLALNFEARMQILSFELYGRLDNLNHSMYEPAAGYTPEGVRILYGINWTFGN